MELSTPVCQTLYTAVHEAGVAQVGKASLAPWTADFLQGSVQNAKRALLLLHDHDHDIAELGAKEQCQVSVVSRLWV
jgi:hypothetical protein